MLVFAVSIAVVCAPQRDERDTVRLQSGAELRGRVVLETDAAVHLTAGSRERVVDRAEVAEVRSVAVSLRELLARFGRLDHPGPAQLEELARFAAGGELPHEAALLRWRILLDHPGHAPAHEALGHRRRGDEWAVRLNDRWTTVERAERAAEDFDDALELRSEHFTLRASTSLRRAIDTLFELEHLYGAFYAAFQRPLELRELLEPIGVHVYRDRKQFPQQSGQVGAFFSPGENVIYTYLGLRGEPQALFHEGTHAILHNAIARAAKSRGRIPAWLDEGWAEYMEGTLVRRGGGRVDAVEGRKNVGTLAIGRDDADDPYTLRRLFTMQAPDFGASSKQGLKYAQSYALFWTCLHGEGERWRAAFFDYLRDAVAGRGSYTTFAKTLGDRDVDAVERAHLAAIGG